MDSQKKNDVLFSKTQLLNSNTFNRYKDIINSIVLDDDFISKSDLHNKINVFLNKNYN